LWGAARAALGRAQDILGIGKAPPRFARLMARLEESEGGDAAAARRWLMAAADSAGDAAWICSHCGASSALWAGRCGHCHEFDSLAWREPARQMSAGDGLPAIEAVLPERSPPVLAIAHAGSDASAAPIDAARRVN
jgi:HemY protein